MNGGLARLYIKVVIHKGEKGARFYFFLNNFISLP